MACMDRTLRLMAVSASLALLVGAAAAADPPSESAETSPAAADLPALTPDTPVVTAEPPAVAAEGVPPTQITEAGDSQPVKEVTLDPTAKPPVCRRYVPTGSRIATERCRSAEVSDAVRAAERDQARRDIDEMRVRQATRDAARAAAQAESLRRSVGF
jgi:hypothetical protein